jgi:hypothetical protein
MVLEFFRKIFDLIVGGTLRTPAPDEVEEQQIHWQATTKSVENLKGLMDNTPLQTTEGMGHLDKRELFQWILLLLQLVTTACFGFPAWKPKPDEAD